MTGPEPGTQPGLAPGPAPVARPTVAILGLGLIGGSIARALVAQGVAVSGFDASAATRSAAAVAGISVTNSIEALCASAPDILILAVPLRVMRPTAAVVAQHVCPTTVVTDVGSVKGVVREELYAAGLRGRYVGAHPMFGTEHTGFAASDADVAVGAAWAVTVDEATQPAQVAAVVGLITGLLGGHVFTLADDVHDEVVALISHVPHVLATELLALVAATPVAEIALGLAAGSFRDGTRVGRTDPRRTEAMVTDNAAWVASALRVVIRDLEHLVELLETNQSAGEFFDRPDPVRSAGSWGPGELSTVALTGQWRQTLCAAGARGWAIVRVDPSGQSVTLAG